jgi:hypothetical protein
VESLRALLRTVFTNSDSGKALAMRLPVPPVALAVMPKTARPSVNLLQDLDTAPFS